MLRFPHKNDARFVFTPFVCRRAHVLFMLFMFVCVHSGFKHVLVLSVTWRVSDKRHERLTLRERLCSPPVFGGVRIAYLLVFCVVFLVLFASVLCFVHPMLPVSLDCPFFIAPSVFSNIYMSVVDFVPCQQRLNIEIEKCSDHSKRVGLNSVRCEILSSVTIVVYDKVRGQNKAHICISICIGQYVVMSDLYVTKR